MKVPMMKPETLAGFIGIVGSPSHAHLTMFVGSSESAAKEVASIFGLKPRNVSVKYDASVDDMSTEQIMRLYKKNYAWDCSEHKDYGSKPRLEVHELTWYKNLPQKGGDGIMVTGDESYQFKFDRFRITGQISAIKEPDLTKRLLDFLNSNKINLPIHI